MNEWGKAGIGLGAGIVDSAIGQGLGLVFGGIQDRRQREQAKKLGRIQADLNKEQAEHSQKLAMKMWEDTNYGAQKEQMEKAGLNVGLMYGGGGAGGGTAAGAGTAAPVSGQSAGDPNAGVGMGLQMASQIALMKAQKENIEADTENKKAETGKTGIETKQGELNLDTATKTQADTIEKIYQEARTAMATAKQEAVKGVISEETQNEQIQKIKAETATSMLETELKKGQIKLNEAQIKEIAEKIAQGWKGLEFQGVDKITGKYIEMVAQKLLGLGGVK